MVVLGSSMLRNVKHSVVNFNRVTKKLRNSKVNRDYRRGLCKFNYSELPNKRTITAFFLGEEIPFFHLFSNFTYVVNSLGGTVIWSGTFIRNLRVCIMLPDLGEFGVCMLVLLFFSFKKCSHKIQSRESSSLHKPLLY